MRPKTYIAMLCSKITLIILKLLNKQGSFFPGKLAMKIDKDYLKSINKAKHIICITGTNGKTTTTNLVADSLEKLGVKLTSNRLGANIDSGIATSLTNNINIFGHIKNDYMVLEVDERYSRLILPFINPEYLVVTNLTRDSLKRNAHSDYIFSILDTYTPKDTKLILNADCLCSSRLCKDNDRVFYGIAKLKTDTKVSKNIINDYRLCPICNSKLKYNYLRYHHIGNAKCPNCGFKSYDANYRITKIDDNITINYRDKNYEFSKINDAMFNIYNELAAITLLFEMGYNYTDIKNVIKSINIVDSRYKETKVGNTNILRVMAKGQNSVACSSNISYISKYKGTKILLISLDDNYERYHSQEFIGWIYDIDFEFLDDTVKQVMVVGPRCYDYIVRLEMAGIPKSKLVAGIDEFKTIEKLDLDVDNIFLLIDITTISTGIKLEEKVIEMLGEK